MKITYLNTPRTRAGLMCSVDEVEHGEKFRVISQRAQMIANYLKSQGDKADKFKRRGDHLYRLKKIKSKNPEKEFTWQKVVAYYFRHTTDRYNWMNNIKIGTAEIIVEIY